MPEPVPVNVVVVKVAGTVTGVGTLSAALFDVTVTLNPPGRAALVSVIVQVVVVTPDTMLAGLHDNPETDGGGVTVTVVEAVPPFKLAVTVAVWSVRPLPLAINVVLTALAGTTTGLGTLSARLFDVTVTLAPPAGATPLSVSVQVAVVPDTILDGLHDTVEGVTCAAFIATMEVCQPVALDNRNCAA